MRYAVFLAGLMLAACGQRDEGTSISIDGNGGTASVDGRSGAVSVDTPAFSGTFKLPKMNLTAENFDVNGVHLYPDSRIEAMNVEGRGKDDGTVTVRFASPAAPATVADWFRREFAKKGMTVTGDAASLRGKSEDDPVAIDLQADGDARTRGTIRIG